MNKYTPKEIESKWIERWEKDRLYKTPTDLDKKKFYSLYSFPYPSGDGLHVGHAEGMVANDIAARFNRMKGKNVLLPMGWDSFGLPAENFAIKTGTPPHESTERAIVNFIDQIKNLGISVDWNLEVGAHRADYYKWTQWIFLQLYKKGLAYRKNAPVNWCPKDQTVLANEQVVDGRCERCDTLVEKKDMEQWFFKITDYAERLVKDLDKVDWPESTKAVQRHWIGQSEGTNVQFAISTTQPQINSDISIRIATENDASGIAYVRAMGWRDNNISPSTGIDIKFLEEVMGFAIPLSEDRIESTKNYIAKNPECHIVAEKDGLIVGWIGMTFEESGRISFGVYTHPEHRGQGIGTSLMQYMFAKYPSKVFELDVTTTNIKAIELYKRLGFVVTGETKWSKKEYPDNVLPVVTMERNTSVEVFTTRVDTIFGCTFLVVAPEHKILKNLKSQISNLTEVEEYISASKSKTELERQSQKEKTGVEIKGIKAINPFSNEEIPVFVADYVLSTYGTGAIMAVPAHDERDGEFAQKYNIELKQVIKPENEEYITCISRDWSNDFDKFISSAEELNPIYINKSKDSVIFKFKAEFINKYIEIASESVNGKRAWHDAISENEAVIIFGQSDPYTNQAEGVNVCRIKKFDNQDSTWAQMVSFEERVREFKSMWHMLANSDYKEKVLNTDYGILTNSGEYSGLTSEEATKKMQQWLEEQGVGHRKTTFRLRDWLVSRQRYWGCPIPIVYDPEGNPHPIHEKHLPLLLPTDVDFKPTGESPIKSSESFKKLAEEKFGKGWHFEADTMDTFVDSSWYFLRYADNGNDNQIFTKQNVNYWNPADLYMIGAEHTVLHLMYARFFTKFLFDEGYINFDEPFAKLRHMGIISGSDGRKMSKRWGNVINPNDEVAKYSADTVRMYEMFMGPLEEPKLWNDNAESGVFRFLNKVWDLSNKVSEVRSAKQDTEVNKLIQKIDKDTEALAFNTAVAKFMEFVNFAQKEETLFKEVFQTFLKLLAPYAPFITEELWHKLGNTESIHLEKFPEVDESKIIEDQINIAVQFNGKSRGVVIVSPNATEDEIITIVKAHEKLGKYITNSPKKIIYIKGKIINIIVD